jgi:hypothetical protein
MTRRELSHDEVFLHQPALEWRVRSWMRLVQRRPENRDRATTALQRLFVRGGIDSRGQAADDHDIPLDQCADEPRDTLASW